MKKWKKETLTLRPDHVWTGKPGCRVFVADRGAVRFDFPQDWVVRPDPDSIKFHDAEPPDDNCTLAVSFLRLPPVDFSGLPVAQLIPVAMQGDKRGILFQSDIKTVKRADLELAWIEAWFIDPREQRQAYTRLCIARGAGIQALITCEFWPEDRARIDPVWDDVLDSLRLGVYIKDPTIGR